jgi:FAD/FMN-containing dehydrogenase
VISDPAEAARNPELAVLSLLAHPDRYETVPALLSGFESLGEGLRELYADLVLMALPLAARRHLEDLMKTTEHKYGSSFARGYFDEGRAEGRAEGLAEATVGTKAEAILAVLRARGFDYSEFVSNDIRACTDVEQLDLWLERAATVTAVEDLFDL